MAYQKTAETEYDCEPAAPYVNNCSTDMTYSGLGGSRNA